MTDATDAEKTETNLNGVPDEARNDQAERPGSESANDEHADELVDEWVEDSFPTSDPPAHY
ncbi:hypothetical protein [Brevibacterium sp. ZH18]|uniref:hypothetical protein n=1 Tax=Brevibacterium sp. ZH18 TaxID=2927784 RepID=UPI001F60AE72|nr:hypothetical protein [Brevibacterium sp. ZH18]MCI4011203.1 hypothetical protein [Brevibacterium sp. ZH18]